MENLGFVIPTDFSHCIFQNVVKFRLVDPDITEIWPSESIGFCVNLRVQCRLAHHGSVSLYIETLLIRCKECYYMMFQSSQSADDDSFQVNAVSYQRINFPELNLKSHLPVRVC